jgi:DNA-binding NarL/FixJ family response regulator
MSKTQTVTNLASGRGMGSTSKPSSNSAIIVCTPGLMELPEQDVQSLLQQRKREQLPTRSLVLTATRAQQRRALAAGADDAFRRDGSTAQLLAIATGLCRSGRGSEGTNKALSSGASRVKQQALHVEHVESGACDA